MCINVGQPGRGVGVGVWGDDRSDGADAAGTSHLSHHLGQPVPCRLNSSRTTQLNIAEIMSMAALLSW